MCIFVPTDLLKTNMHMKKISTLFTTAKIVILAAVIGAPAYANAKTVTIFCEDFDTASSEKDELIEDHVWEDNDASMFSWTVSSDDDNINVRTNNASDYDGASGDGNLYFKGSATFTISGISTSGYSDITLTFGAFGKNADDVNNMTLTISDGTTETVIDFSTLSLDGTKKTWSVATISDIPETESLTLTFTSDLSIDDDGGIRLDDITITGTTDEEDDEEDSDDTTDSEEDTDGSVTIFCEDFDTATSEKSELIEDHVWEDNDASMFSWTVSSDDDNINVRTNNASDYDGASGDGNLYFKGSATFTISGISTSGYSDITLTFGAFGKNADDVNNMTLTISDGTTETVIDFSTLGLDTTAKTWSVATVSDIPETESLTLTFTSDLSIDDDGGIRLDDITIKGIAETSDDTETSISSINALSSGTAEVYTLSGMRIATIEDSNLQQLPTGIYIIKTASRSYKAVIR